MQDYKFIQNIIYCLFMLFVLNTVVGCNQKATTERPNLSSKVESLNTTKPTAQKPPSSSQPAVIYRSNNLGTTWTSFAKGIPADATLSGITQYLDKVYVTTDYHGVFVISNGQDAWTSLTIDNFKGLDINCIEVNANKLVLGTLKHGILISNDGGVHWKQAKKGIPNSSIRAFIRVTDKLYAGTDLGIFESVDMGTTWSHTFGQLQILGFTYLDGKIYAATQNGALMCEGNAKEWTSIYDGDALHDIGNDGQYIYAMTIGQQLLKTQNDGGFWQQAQNGITRPPNFYTNEIQHIGNDIFSAQWIGIYHSSNNGNNWNKLNGLPNSTAFSTLAITDLGIIAGISIR